MASSMLLPREDFFCLLYTSLLLGVLALAADSGPELTRTDQDMLWNARRGYPRLSLLGAEKYQVFSEEDLNFYKVKLHRLGAAFSPPFELLLHEHAQRGPFVEPVGGSVSNPLQTAKYYSTWIAPDRRDELSRLMGLHETTKQTPYGKTAMAFWKYKKGRVRLLRITTIPHDGFPYTLRRLGEVIPLGRIRSIH
ncbi:uncharacterized protein UTRI_10680 [Ustilago trichophora]|uniref:Effector family protein Eff1 n=1 Tax=Ustilago trichophora TaxID=86804 RepID=A0A5C3E9V2_9BASI|nr:uncharacterized protein UTRI_10680 [Ustilago trichophora]